MLILTQIHMCTCIFNILFYMLFNSVHKLHIHIIVHMFIIHMLIFGQTLIFLHARLTEQHVL